MRTTAGFVFLILHLLGLLVLALRITDFFVSIDYEYETWKTVSALVYLALVSVSAGCYHLFDTLKE